MSNVSIHCPWPETKITDVSYTIIAFHRRKGASSDSHEPITEVVYRQSSENPTFPVPSHQTKFRNRLVVSYDPKDKLPSYTVILLNVTDEDTAVYFCTLLVSFYEDEMQKVRFNISAERKLTVPGQF